MSDLGSTFSWVVRVQELLPHNLLYESLAMRPSKGAPNPFSSATIIYPKAQAPCSPQAYMQP